MARLEDLVKSKIPTDADSAFKLHVTDKWMKLNSVQSLKAKEYNDQVKELRKSIMEGVKDTMEKGKKKRGEEEATARDAHGPAETEAAQPLNAGAQTDHEEEHEGEALGGEEDFGSLENVRVSNKAYAATKVNDFVSSFLALSSVGCTVVAMELDFYEERDLEEKIDTILWFSVGLSILLLINLIMGYMLYI